MAVDHGDRLPRGGPVILSANHRSFMELIFLALTVASGAPTVPVEIIGTKAVHGPGERLPHLGKAVTLRFGEPLWPVDQERTPRSHLRELTDQMMDEIALLCGQRHPAAGARRSGA